MSVPKNALHDLMPLLEDLVSVLIARDYKSAELTAVLFWMNSHCNSCGVALTNQNQPEHNVPICADCARNQ
jgi:hypothetical protein